MEMYKIKRSIFGTEVEIELTLGEMNDCYDKIREYNMREILNELLACDGCENVPKEIIDSVVQDALEEQDESGDSVFTAIDTVYKKRNFQKYKQDVPDMSITVGHIIDNPTFDYNSDFIIQADDEDNTVVYESNGIIWDDIPSELLILPIKYITTRGYKLVIEVHV